MSPRLTRTAPSRARRRLAAALALAALTAGGATLLHPAGVRADTNRPAVFTGTAAAAAVHEEDNGQAGFAVYEPFYGSFAEGATTFTSDARSARASTFWPGPTFGNTGSLICQLSCAPVPAYPLSVQTEGPPSQPPSVSQQTSTQLGGSGQPASVTAASAAATADPDIGVSSDAVDGAFAAPGGTAAAASTGGQLAAASAWFHRQVALLTNQPSGAASTAGTAAGSTSTAIVAVRSMTASTSQRFVGSVLVTDAETELSGVSLLAGMVDIASIRTESHARSDGGAVHTHTDNVDVSGVTVAGIPATIGSGGISVSGQGTGSALLGSVNAALQQALAAAGADVTLVGATAKPPQPLGGCTGDQADGVFVHTTANVQAVPVVGDIYNGDYTLGSACASAVASAPGLGLPGAPGVTVPGGGASPGGSAGGPVAAGSGSAGSALGVGAPGGASGVALSASGPTGATGGAGTAGALPAGSSASGRAGTETTALLAPLVSRRFSTLYLSVVLALAAVVVGLGIQAPRVALPRHRLEERPMTDDVISPPSGTARPAPGADENLPDPALFWRWAAGAAMPWAGWVLAALGLVVIIVGWFGVSGQALVAKQLPYLISGGLGGVALVGIGAAMISAERRRQDTGRIERLEEMVGELRSVLLDHADAAAAEWKAPMPNGRGPTGGPVAIPTGTTYHSPSCQMVRGKDGVQSVTARAIGERGLSACRVCEPVLPVG